MTAQKKPAVTSTSKNVPAAATAEREKNPVSLHRTWLIVLAALIIIPWVIAGAIYFQRSAEPASSASAGPTREASVVSAAPGPWGEISLTRIVISPPLEYVAADWGRGSGPDEWYFPGTPTEVMEAFLLSTGLTREQVSQVRATARPEPRTNGVIVRPDPALVRSLSRQTRARLYLELAKTSLNFDQENAFRFHGSSTEEWLGGSLISAQTRQLVEPLIYRDGEFLLFADPEAIRSQVRDPEELRRLAKALLRQPTVLAKLTVRDERQVESLAEYWGRGGRRTDLRPLLESVAESAEPTIDIVHLLPTFARNQLYRYPRLTAADFQKPVLANCLWSSLNFFNARPDDRFLDINVALNTLQRDYFIVESGFQLGDVVAFVDKNGNLFHVASYLADGLVFTKNGTSTVAPWVITTTDELKGYYRWRSSNPRLIYHRRNDL